MLSFTIVGIYWNNHHHLFQAVRVVDGRVLWANLLLLFWLSLLPFSPRGWARRIRADPGRRLRRGPAAGGDRVLCPGARAAPLQPDDAPRPPIGNDTKGKLSPVVYLVSIPIALVAPLVAFGLFVLVALVWFVPDRRIERTLSH